jgi:hypothetical protein
LETTSPIEEQLVSPEQVSEDDSISTIELPSPSRLDTPPPPIEIPFSPKVIPPIQEPLPGLDDIPSFEPAPPAPKAPPPPPGLDDILSFAPPPPAPKAPPPPPGLDDIPSFEPPAPKAPAPPPAPIDVPFSPKAISPIPEPPPTKPGPLPGLDDIPSFEPAPPAPKAPLPPPEHLPPLELSLEAPLPPNPRRTPAAEPLLPPEASAQNELSPFIPEPPPAIDPFLMDDDLPSLGLASPDQKAAPQPAPLPTGIGSIPHAPPQKIPQPGLPLSPETMPPAGPPTPEPPKVIPSIKIPEIKKESTFKRLLPLIITLGVLIVVIALVFKPGSGSREKKSATPVSRQAPQQQTSEKPAITAFDIQLEDIITFSDPNGFYVLSLPEGFDKTDESSWERSKINFNYPDKTLISITAQAQKEDWQAQDEMKKKIDEIESGTAGTLSLYSVKSYKLLQIGDVRGFDLTLERTGFLSHYYYMVDPGKNALSITFITEGADRQGKHDFIVKTIEESLQIY